MKRCAARRAISRTRCETPATNKVTVGCVHEHITEGFACEEHVSQLADGAINCAACYRSDDWHVCPLLARVEPIDDEGVMAQSSAHEPIATGGDTDA